MYFKPNVAHYPTIAVSVSKLYMVVVVGGELTWLLDWPTAVASIAQPVEHVARKVQVVSSRLTRSCSFSQLQPTALYNRRSYLADSVRVSVQCDVQSIM